MDRPIIFVVHSMGGLVVAEGLNRSKDSCEAHLENIYQQTFAIAFLGTPHRGSGLAFWADLGTKFLRPVKRINQALLQVLRERSETLDDIQQRFNSMIRKRQDNSYRESQKLPYPIQIYCFYEELALKGVGKVVEEDSARLDTWPYNSIHANHMGMSRFPDAQDPGFMRVIGMLWGWVDDLKKLRASAVIENGANRLEQLLPSLPIDQQAASSQDSVQTKPEAQATSQSKEPQPESSSQASHQPKLEVRESFNSRQPQPQSPQTSSKQDIDEDETSELTGKGKGRDNTNRVASRKTDNKPSLPQQEQKKTGGSTFTINQKKGGQWAIANTINIKGGGSLFAAPTMSSGRRRGPKGALNHVDSDSNEDSDDSG